MPAEISLLTRWTASDVSSGGLRDTVYTNITQTTTMTNMIVDIMVKVLAILAVAAKNETWTIR